jgi:hypothetical protein
VRGDKRAKPGKEKEAVLMFGIKITINMDKHRL